MNREWNILVLTSMLKDDNLTPLRKYFVWELLKDLQKK